VEGIPLNHPILIAVVVEDRRRGCPCGAVAPESYGLCRACQAVAAWRRETQRTRCDDAADWTCPGNVKARLLTRVASLLQIIGKGAES
jgi:hypothetical protein